MDIFKYNDWDSDDDHSSEWHRILWTPSITQQKIFFPKLRIFCREQKFIFGQILRAMNYMGKCDAQKVHRISSHFGGGCCDEMR